jgi:hypothetical protein
MEEEGGGESVKKDEGRKERRERSRGLEERAEENVLTGTMTSDGVYAV